MLLFLNICKQIFHISYVGISQKVKCVLIWNLQQIIWLSVKARMGDRGTEWREWWECGESGWDSGNQGGNAENKGRNAGNQGGNDKN